MPGFEPLATWVNELEGFIGGGIQIIAGNVVNPRIFFELKNVGIRKNIRRIFGE
jgi:hypothetical protein